MYYEVGPEKKKEAMNFTSSPVLCCTCARVRSLQLVLVNTVVGNVLQSTRNVH